MKNRNEKIVLEADKGLTFEVSKGTNGEVIVRALNIVNVESENYANPPIPEGYEHVQGKWNDGFVIERCSDGSQFVWIPVGYLDSNGTLDGRHFPKKFGRRNYRSYANDCFSDKEFHEPLEGELLKQFRSVKKYGGFYISRYNISKSVEGKPQSVKGEMPWVKINFFEAKKVASEFENCKDVKSHLPFGCEYDSVLEWFIESGVRTLEDIAEDSTDWGNYLNTDEIHPKNGVKTGLNERWCTNRICDFAGNVNEWTQEKYGNSEGIVRGGCYLVYGYREPVAHRNKFYYTHNSTIVTGFRVSLCIY